MKYEDLSPKMQELLEGLWDASSTIESDIGDALEDAVCEENLASYTVSKMEDLAQEAYWWGKSVLDVSKGGEPLPHTMRAMFQIE